MGWNFGHAKERAVFRHSSYTGQLCETQQPFCPSIRVKVLFGLLKPYEKPMAYALPFLTFADILSDKDFKSQMTISFWTQIGHVASNAFVFWHFKYENMNNFEVSLQGGRRHVECISLQESSVVFGRFPSVWTCVPSQATHYIPARPCHHYPPISVAPSDNCDNQMATNAPLSSRAAPG